MDYVRLWDRLPLYRTKAQRILQSKKSDFDSILFSHDFIQDAQLRIERLNSYLQNLTRKENTISDKEFEDLSLILFGIGLGTFTGSHEIEKKTEYKAVDCAIWHDDCVAICQSKQYSIGSVVKDTDIAKFHSQGTLYYSEYHANRRPLFLYVTTGKLTSVAFKNFLKIKKNNKCFFAFGPIQIAEMVRDVYSILQCFKKVGDKYIVDYASLAKQLRNYQNKFIRMLQGKKTYTEHYYVNQADLRIILQRVRKTLKPIESQIQQNLACGLMGKSRIEGKNMRSGVNLRPGTLVYIMTRYGKKVRISQIVTIGQKKSAGIYEIKSIEPAEFSIKPEYIDEINLNDSGGIFRISKNAIGE
jgi:hypothetical protein